MCVAEGYFRLDTVRRSCAETAIGDTGLRPCMTTTGGLHIAIRYWMDVGKAIRQILLADGEYVDH